MKKIRFVSNNQYKIVEVKQILERSNIEVIPINLKIDEIQTDDVKKLVKDKVLKAFDIIGKEVFVEHTGLYIRSLNDFPGGLTQIFWDKLGADTFAKIVCSLGDAFLIAKTVIGYCDSQKIHFFEGKIGGNVPDTPKGNRDFQWDCVFIPEGHKKTFAEMGCLKNDISMRKKAIENFCKYLTRSSK
ncbi:MAG: non-canonical purine NTP pyrophosphatase [Planctomycetes bacterium GWF2_42_9]|nr:MAG: non-canonical purine NTP pyrophosphatase [Planctomycetes bacterium GWF2_42_9]